MLKISSTTRSSKNLLLSINIIEFNEFNIDNGDNNYKDKTVKKLSSKNLNGAVEYLTPEARLAFI